jgi:hypothetical protein
MHSSAIESAQNRPFFDHSLPGIATMSGAVIPSPTMMMLRFDQA